MDITHVKEGEITIVTVNGRLDVTTAPAADKTIKKIRKDKGRKKGHRGCSRAR